jgi:hypothetical protein
LEYVPRCRETPDARRPERWLILALVLVPACQLLVDTDGLSERKDGPGADAGPPGNGLAGDGSTDAPDVDLPDAPLEPPVDAGASFRDEFERPAQDVIGNGWIEKTPAVFVLADGKVTKPAATVTSYRNNMVYRPSSEDQRDVEISIELETLAVDAFPQVFLRARRSTIEQEDVYDGYLFYRDGDSNTIRIGRQSGAVFVHSVASAQVSPTFDMAKRYRLVASARGELPVALAFRLERLDSGAWSPNGEVTYDDSDADRFTDAGALGFAIDESAGATYDNFTWRALSP